MAAPTSTARKDKDDDGGVTAALAETLRGIQGDGDFAVGGRRATPMPHLIVDGVGTVALPLLPVQAVELIARAERAPYGRGPDTLVDTAVRRSWQLAPDRLGKPLDAQRAWAKTVRRITRRAARLLGVDGRVRAELYKVLIYEAGDFFVDHRDSEKVDGMFATLVVSLPAVHRGGALVVQHQGRERRFGLGVEAPSHVTWAAFYADCVHRLEPIESGHRLVLVYNLLLADAGSRPRVPDHHASVRSAIAVLARWSAAPTKLIALLDHHYTQAGLSFAALKGRDRAVTSVLVDAAAAADCVCHLAMVSIFESGAAEAVDSRRRGRWRATDDVEAFEVIEVFERRQALEHWSAPGGPPTIASPLPFTFDEVSPPGAIDDESSDEVHFMEATGNEGGSYERTYRRAAIVVWPHARELSVLAVAGPSTTLPRLRALIAARSPDASMFAGALVAAGTIRDHASLAEAIPLLAQVDDGALLEQLMSDDVTSGLALAPLGASIATALATCGWRRVGWLERAVALRVGLGAGRWGERDRDDLARFLSTLLVAAPDDARHLVEIAIAESRAGPASWVRGPMPSAGPLAELLWTLVRAAPDLVSPLRDRVLDAGFGDAARVALALALGSTRHTPLAAITQAAVAELQGRISTALEPPSDWRRAAKLQCHCEHCAAATAFMVNPELQTWQLRANENVRRHVASHLEGHDVRFETRRGTSPLTLVCHKTLASYHRRVAAMDADRAAFARLREMLGD